MDSPTAPATEATAAEAQPSVNAFTVLFNAVEIANRRGAYSLKESAMISRALDAVREVYPQPAPEAAADTVEEAAAAPTIA